MANSLVQVVRDYTERQSGGSPFFTDIDGMWILRADHDKPASHRIFKPALCVVVQGSKWSTFGDRRFDYKAGQALLVSIEMPALSKVVDASPEEPYLSVVIELDLAAMREVMVGIDIPAARASSNGQGVLVTEIDGPLSDCILRMVRLLETPQAVAVLAPLIMREMCYWLLTGPHGHEVAQIVLAKGHVPRVINAIYALRDQFTKSVRIEELAAIAQLSLSAFHRQFKELTSMTPLQYQKRLRLLEARHLMISGVANAETAAYQVGYESASQFSREYFRMFGSSPRRDIVLLREAVAD